MKRLFLALLLLPTFVFAKPIEVKEKDVKDALVIFALIYPTGVKELVTEIEFCYENKKRPLATCLALDLYSGYVDKKMTSQIGFPRNEFWSDESAEKRRLKYMSQAELEKFQEQISKFLSESFRE